MDIDVQPPYGWVGHCKMKGDEMIIGIHPDRIGEESYSEKWTESLCAYGVEVRILNLLALNALEQARQCDGVMWRWAHNPQDKQVAPRVLYTIEKYLGIPVYPNHDTAWHYDEKVAQYYLLQTLGVPMPRTWIFWDRESALEWARNTDYPKIFKLSCGAGSANVVKVASQHQAAQLIDQMFGRGVFPYTMNEYRPAILPRNLRQFRGMLARIKQGLKFGLKDLYPPLPSFSWRPEKGYVYFQEFLPNNDFDVRITVVGERAFGFRRLNRPEDFRASGSGRIEYNPAVIEPRCIEIAFHISERGGFQSMAYDFLFRQGQPVICEISYAYADWAVQKCHGHWKPDLTWVEGNMWPEEAQVEDFIKYIREVKNRK